MVGRSSTSEGEGLKLDIRFKNGKFIITLGVDEMKVVLHRLAKQGTRLNKVMAQELPIKHMEIAKAVFDCCRRSYVKNIVNGVMKTKD